MEQQTLTFTSFQQFIELFQEKNPIHVDKEIKKKIIAQSANSILRTYLYLKFDVGNNNVDSICQHLATLSRELFIIMEEIITTPEAKVNLYKDLEQIIFFPQHSLTSKVEEHTYFGREYIELDRVLNEFIETGKHASNHRTVMRSAYPRLFQSIVRISLYTLTPPLMILQDVIQ